jgi:MFS family permease
MQMMLGLLVGSFTGGRLGDAFGRKPVMFSALGSIL